MYLGILIFHNFTFFIIDILADSFGIEEIDPRLFFLAFAIYYRYYLFSRFHIKLWYLNSNIQALDGCWYERVPIRNV